MAARQVFGGLPGSGLEMSGTNTTYDADDRATTSTHWERRHDVVPAASDPPDPLTASNSVRTYTHSWYDLAGRLRATASLGTHHPGNIFANPTGGPPNYSPHPSYAPLQYDAGGSVIGCNNGPFGTGGTFANALCTCYDYDSAGRQSAVWHPDGTVTRYEYDGLNRLVLSIENATGEGTEPPSHEATQVTARVTLQPFAATFWGSAGSLPVWR